MSRGRWSFAVVADPHEEMTKAAVKTRARPVVLFERSIMACAVKRGP
jgi:hypothetical protein